MTRSQSIRLGLVAIGVAAFATAGWAALDMRRTYDKCNSYRVLYPRLVGLTLTNKWSWRHLEARCVFRDPRTNTVVEELRPP
jgi:hypothetical protein